MSVWKFSFLLFVILNSPVFAKDDQKSTIGEKLDDIIKDVSEYLLWLFGYGEESVEDQVEVSEIYADGLLKDFNEMIDLMNEEAEKRIEHAKEIRKTENDEDKHENHEIFNVVRKKPRKEDTSEDTSETKETEKKSDNIAVIPI